jgi:Cu/Ag efflux protein CusF
VLSFIAISLALAAATPSADLHGTVRGIDRAHGLLTVHHAAHAGMAMEMTMAVKLRDPHAFARLHVGDHVQLRCDASADPWVCVVVAQR